MPPMWRVHVTAPDAEQAKAFEELFYKKLYESAGNRRTFELPESDEAAADQIVDAAKAKGFEATKERFEDPLESSDTAVDFW